MIYKILSKFRIHHSKDETMCPHCNNREEFHLQTKTHQSNTYFADKNKVASGLYPDDVVIVQDFTQLNP